MRLGLILLAINALVFWALWVRLRHALPSRKGRIAIAVAYWLLLLPTLAMPFDAGALRAFRSDAPLWMSVPSMTLQFAVLCYGIWLVAFSGPLHFWQRLRARRKAAPGPQPAAAQPEMPVPAAGQPDPQRRDFLKRTAMLPPALIVLGSGIGAVGAMQAPVIKRVQLPVPADRTNLRGLRIVQCSDVHIGRFCKREQLQAIAAVMNSQRPDIVVCTGDLLDHAMEQLPPAQELLRSVHAPKGRFMCLGNHEYYAAGGAMDELIRGIEESGTRLLRDEHEKISVGSDHLWMLGIDYPGRRLPAASFDHALQGIPDDGAPRIVLAHTPASFWEGRTRAIDLQLSGHTHGGQVSLGRIGQYELSPVLPIDLYHAGEYEYQGRRLYVNAGTGAWMPVRINCPPEITLIELV